MSNDDPKDPPLNEALDRYVRQGMEDIDEAQFEAEYLGDPELLEQVKLTTRMVEGLKREKAQKHKHAPVKHRLTGEWLRYFAVPQTAWGAIAASLLLVPIALMLSGTRSTGSPENVEVKRINLERYRGSASVSTPSVNNFSHDGKALVIGFDVGASLGPRKPYDLSIFDSDGALFWQSKGLKPDSESMVYVYMRHLGNQRETYNFLLTLSDSQDPVAEGTFQIGGE